MTEEIIQEDCWNHIGVWGQETPRCEKLTEAVHCRNCSVFSSASQKMLNRELPQNYQDDWAEVYSNEKQIKETEKMSVLVFRLGDEWLALQTKLINEVAEMAPIHRVPHQNSHLIRGLVNIRGELKICISIGSILCLERSKKQKEQTPKETYEKTSYDRMIVVSQNENDFVFPVSEVIGIHRFSQTDVQNVPTTVSKSKATYTSGIINWDSKNIACLDHELLFYFLNRSFS